MKDKELLEYAAIAVGLDIRGEVDKCIGQPSEEKAGGFVVANDKGGESCWNPLKDDGDALRLAVRLEIRCGFAELSGNGYASWNRGNNAVHEFGPDNPYSAVRRAIVRAAAEIAQDKQEKA